MKVLILTFYYRPDLSAGSFRTTALVKSIKAQYPNIEVDVVTTLPNRYSSYHVDAPAEEIDGNVRIKRVQIPKHSSGLSDQIRSFVAFFKAANAYVKGKHYDVVFATSSRLFTAFAGAKIAKSKKTKLYLDIRDIFRESIGDVLKNPARHALMPALSAIEAYTFKSAERINLVSGGFATYFTGRFPRPTYTYYTNGIDQAFIPDRQVRTEKSAAVPHTDGPVRMLYAGNIGDGQGLHIIVPQVAKRLGRQVEITIIGDGGKRAALEKATAGLTNVRLRPPVQRMELPVLYRSADVLFLHLNDYPAFKRVLPSKIFEYAASGKPILAGVGGYAATFLKEKVTNVQVFSPNDGEAGSHALKRLDLGYTDRQAFTDQYERMSIMHAMVRDLVELARD